MQLSTRFHFGVNIKLLKKYIHLCIDCDHIYITRITAYWHIAGMEFTAFRDRSNTKAVKVNSSSIVLLSAIMAAPKVFASFNLFLVIVCIVPFQVHD